MMVVVAAGIAEGEFLGAFQVRDLVQDPVFEEGVNNAVYGYAITAMGQFAFQVGLGQGVPVR